MFPTNDLCAQALDDFNHLLSEVQQAQILLDTCVFASTPARPEADSGTEYSGGAGRRILVGNPPPRPPFGCVTYKYYLSYFWANAEVTRNALGIKEGSVGEWVRCHNADLPYTIDLRSSIEYHRNVTANGGYRALVYSGDHDAVVPHLGTQAWIRSLGFPVAHHWRAWHLHGQSAGFTLTYSNNMTFATIKVTLAFLICLDAQAGSNQVPFGCCRVAGTPRRSTSPRGASPCSADGYSTNNSSTPNSHDQVEKE
uniref:Uncharacterized protein n=1 Tax=Aegilops tauschii subsp. strangulata TaxID=200361 RepID=A0A453FQI5_AEGTS